MGDKEFKRLVNYIELDGGKIEEGLLWITMNDEKPWLCVGTVENEEHLGVMVCLNPELATHWLNKIKKFYDFSEQTTQEEES